MIGTLNRMGCVLCDEGVPRTWEAVEREFIFEALRDHGGNKTQTALSIEMSLRTLRNKLARYRYQGFNLETGRLMTLAESGH